MADVHALTVEKYVVGQKNNASLSATEVKKYRDILKQNLAEKSNFVLVNFSRKALNQPGSGHISPLGAYDDKTDSFLVLDVNPFGATWFWVSTSNLLAAMNTFDTEENRGFLTVSDKN